MVFKVRRRRVFPGSLAATVSPEEVSLTEVSALLASHWKAASIAEARGVFWRVTHTWLNCKLPIRGSIKLSAGSMSHKFNFISVAVSAVQVDCNLLRIATAVAYYQSRKLHGSHSWCAVGCCHCSASISKSLAICNNSVNADLSSFQSRHVKPMCMEFSPIIFKQLHSSLKLPFFIGQFHLEHSSKGWKHDSLIVLLPNI